MGIVQTNREIFLRSDPNLFGIKIEFIKYDSLLLVESALTKFKILHLSCITMEIFLIEILS